MKPPLVMLIHGFHRSAVNLESMADFFRNRGYCVLVPELPTTRGKLPQCVAALEQFWQSEPREFSDVHLIGHSYGGLILRAFLAQNKIEGLASLTCFGSSHHGSRIADVLCCLGRHRKEPALQEFRTPGQWIPPPVQGWPRIVHLIAGNRNALWLGRLFLHKPADGRLSVASALALDPGGVICNFPANTIRTILPLDHHEMMDDFTLYLSILEHLSIT
jgi:pimeloyl-ACP methyl ester carboxylesterase